MNTIRISISWSVMYYLVSLSLPAWAVDPRAIAQHAHEVGSQKSLAQGLESGYNECALAVAGEIIGWTALGAAPGVAIAAGGAAKDFIEALALGEGASTEEILEMVPKLSNEGAVMRQGGIVKTATSAQSSLQSFERSQIASGLQRLKINTQENLFDRFIAIGKERGFIPKELQLTQEEVAQLARKAGIQPFTPPSEFVASYYVELQNALEQVVGVDAIQAETILNDFSGELVKSIETGSAGAVVTGLEHGAQQAGISAQAVLENMDETALGEKLSQQAITTPGGLLSKLIAIGKEGEAPLITGEYNSGQVWTALSHNGSLNQATATQVLKFHYPQLKQALRYLTSISEDQAESILAKFTENVAGKSLVPEKTISAMPSPVVSQPALTSLVKHAAQGVNLARAAGASAIGLGASVATGLNQVEQCYQGVEASLGYVFDKKALNGTRYAYLTIANDTSKTIKAQVYIGGGMQEVTIAPRQGAEVNTRPVWAIGGGYFDRVTLSYTADDGTLVTKALYAQKLVLVNTVYAARITLGVDGRSLDARELYQLHG